MWRYRQIKNMEAPLACRFRISQPYCTSRQMWAIDEKAVEISAV